MKRTVSVPEGVQVTVSDGRLAVKGPKGEVSKLFSPQSVSIAVSGKSVSIETGDRRKQKSLAGTFEAHLYNMFGGVISGYEAKLKVVHSHFPMKVKVDGQHFVVENFLGEKRVRKLDIPAGVTVKVAGAEVILSGIDKETVSVTAALIERLTKISGFDKRVFQDGIYLTQKTQTVGAGAS